MKPEYAFQVVWSTEDEAYLAVPYELPGCIADGKTPEEAIANLRVIIQEWIETAREEGRSIPEPMTAQRFEEIQRANEEQFRRSIQMQVAAAVESVMQQIIQAQPQQQLGRVNRLTGGLLTPEEEHCGE